MRRWIVLFAAATTVACVLALVAAIWSVHRTFDPAPESYQDTDRIPQLADSAGLAKGLDGIAVDHVFYYCTRHLGGGDWYLRCHIVHDADFERYEETVCRHRKECSPSEVKDQERATRELQEAYGHKEIRSWWDWADKPDRKVRYFPVNDIVVFDEARRIVYIAHGTTF